MIEQDAEAVRRDRAPLVAREREANPRWEPGDVERSVRGIEEADARAIVAALSGPLRWDLEALLAGGRRPDARARRARRAGDLPARRPARPCAAPTARRCAAALAPDRFVVIDGGHCLHRDDAARWVEAVDGFARAALG